jgi:replicative DNA helicase
VLKGALEHTGVLDDAGGVPYLLRLASAMVGLLGVAEYARAIIDAAVRRQLIDVAETLRERAYRTAFDDGSVADAASVLTWGSAELDRVAATASDVAGTTLASAVQSAISQSEAAQRGSAGAVGLSTGLPSLDQLWGGLYPGSLDIIGARPKTGKTALALQIARSVAGEIVNRSEKGCVAILSLEMPAADLGLVNLAAMTDISADAIRRGSYGTQQAEMMIQAQRALSVLPIEINDSPRMSLADGTGWLRAVKRTKGARLAIVDHRNLFGRDERTSGMGKLDFYQEISQSLKATAKALSMPILLLVQIGRGVEGRDDPRPRMSDLEYAGEQDADNIVLLYRPELHAGGAPDKRPTESAEAHANRVSAYWQHRREITGRAQAIFAKRRFGPEGICELRFDGPTLTFSGLPIADDDLSLFSDE